MLRPASDGLTSGDDGMIPILGSDATVPCVLRATLGFPLLQSAAAVTAADAVAVLQLAATSQSSVCFSFPLISSAATCRA